MFDYEGSSSEEERVFDYTGSSSEEKRRGEERSDGGGKQWRQRDKGNESAAACESKEAGCQGSAISVEG